MSLIEYNGMDWKDTGTLESRSTPLGYSNPSQAARMAIPLPFS